MTVSATPLVTRDTPSVPAVTALAAEIQAEQQAKLEASTKLVVGAFFQKLRAEAAFPPGVARTISVDRYAVETMSRNQEHAEAARYGLYPYLQNDASYQALSSAVTAALAPAFHEIVITRDEGLRITVRGFPNEPKPEPGTALAVVKDDSVKTAITALVMAHRSKVNDVRTYAAALAKSPEMRALWDLIREKTGVYSSIKLASGVYLSRSGKLRKDNYDRTPLSKTEIESLSRNALESAVTRIYADARGNKLPEVQKPNRLFWWYL